MAAEKIPGWIERLLLPKLSEISGDIKAVNGRIDALEFNMSTRIDSLESNMNTRMYRFEAINTRLDSLDKRIPV